MRGQFIGYMFRGVVPLPQTNTFENKLNAQYIKVLEKLAHGLEESCRCIL